MQELKLKKCPKCSSIIRVITDNSSSLTCCNEQLQDIIPNSVECASEKHLPQYEIQNDTLKVFVNHVMEEDHYIEWLLVQTPHGNYEKHFNPYDNPTIEVPYEANSKLYSFCNKHGLWITNVD